jgi:replicative DNA helicase
LTEHIAKVLTIGASAQEALKVFRTFDAEDPDLISTGLPPLDDVIGGLFPGTSLVIAGGTGVGKSSTMLAQAFVAASRGANPGIVSLEDGADVLGSRSLALLSGVDSLRIRTKRLSDREKTALADAERRLQRIKLQVSYPIGRGLAGCLEAVEALGKAGCRLIFIDYLQKIRSGKDDRRNEVGQAFTAIQQKCAEHGAASVIISQVSRPQEGARPLTIYSLKESGDIENESRVIVLLERAAGARVLRAKLAKCTFGGEGLTFTLERDASGMLSFTTENQEEGF